VPYPGGQFLIEPIVGLLALELFERQAVEDEPVVDDLSVPDPAITSARIRNCSANGPRNWR